MHKEHILSCFSLAVSMLWSVGLDIQPTAHAFCIGQMHHMMSSQLHVPSPSGIILNLNLILLVKTQSP